MKVALAQLNPTVGDIAGNARAIAQAIQESRRGGASLVIFPELAVIGYPPKDLLLKPSVIEECGKAVESLATQCTDIAAVIGYPAPATALQGRSLYNAAAFCQGGRVVSQHIKSLLPTYDVFDEQRYFEPGPRVDLTAFDGALLGISICEDLWNDRDMFSRQLYHDNPIDQLAAQGAGLFINASASPFVLGKHAFRLKLMSHAAQRYGLPLLYCNQVGGNDELIFDGNSCAFNARGELIAQARDFETDLLFVEVDPRKSDGKGSFELNHRDTEEDEIAEKNRKEEFKLEIRDQTSASSVESRLEIANRIETPKADLESVYHALVLGLKDYCRKCGFRSIVLGLSGGVDSALCAALATAALGKENMRGVAMPSRFSSEGSVNDAAEVARRLSIDFRVIPINGPHDAFEKLLAPQFATLPPDTTEENVQARIRGVILMAFSNKFGALLVTTGNKSELAVGYCTLYGDMAGGLAIISDVPKTMIWKLARWINDSPASPLRRLYGGPPIPEASIVKVPSAELRPNQTDQDTLPPYEVLDQIIENYVEREQSAGQIIAALPEVDPHIILRMIKLIDLNEYKRKQAAPGLKVTGRAFGFGRRMPIAQRYDAARWANQAAAPGD